ncbi:hypothetical protein HpHNI32_15600 [Helicobacter pylori]
MVYWIFRMLNTKYLLFKHYAFKISLCEKLREANLLSQFQGKSIKTF